MLDENGYGKCLKRNSLHNSLFNCIVKMPSFCKDLVKDENNPDLFWSADACEDKNEGICSAMKLLTWYINERQIL